MRRSVYRALVAGAAVVILAGVAVVGIGLWRATHPETDAPPRTERVAVESRADRIVDAEASPPRSIDIAAIRFEAPIAPLERAGADVLDPPGIDEAYWLSDYGLPGVGSDNTVYLIGHTSDSGTAVFDPLVDTASQRPNVEPGDEIVLETEAGEVLYEIVSTDRQDRTALADLEKVWENSPGRLVIITCFFDASRTQAPDNMIVYARQRG